MPALSLPQPEEFCQGQPVGYNFNEVCHDLAIGIVRYGTLGREHSQHLFSSGKGDGGEMQGSRSQDSPPSHDTLYL